MSAKSSAGVTICVGKPRATGTTIAATAATKAKPAVLTVADVTGLKEGQLITLAADSTGLSEIDGKTFVIQNIDGTAQTFELAGSDTTGSAGTFTAGTAATYLADADMQCLCLSEFSFSPETPDTIAAGTYCNPQDSIASAATAAGTFSFAGFIDKTDLGYQFLLDEVGKQNTIMFRIAFPNNGWIIVPGTLDTISWDVPLEGALGFSGSGTLKAAPRHVF